MMKNLANQVFLQTPVEFYVFWLGYFALAWSIPLIANHNLFDIQGFQLFRDIYDGYAFWTALYFIVGSIGISSTVVRNRVFTQIALIMLSMLWLFTTLAFTVPLGLNSGTMVYGTFAAVAFWNFVRVYNFAFESWT